MNLNGRAEAGRALDLDRATVTLDQSIADRKAQTAASAGAFVDAPRGERCERGAEGRLVHPDAVVADRDDRPIGILVDGEVEMPGGRHRLASVRDDIEERELDRLRVEEDRGE